MCAYTYIYIFSSDSLHREVTSAEVEEFQRSTNLLVLPITNTKGPRMASDPSLPDGREGIKVRRELEGKKVSNSSTVCEAARVLLHLFPVV